MSVTFTTSYRETLRAETVAYIDELLEDNYCLEDILEFIDENSEPTFRAYYREYCEAGEAIGYNVVDTYIAENGFCDDLEDLEDRYVGSYGNEREFAEEWITEVQGQSIPDGVIVDWDATWRHNLYYDFTTAFENYNTTHFFLNN